MPRLSSRLVAGVAAAMVGGWLGVGQAAAQQNVVWWDYSGGGDGVRLKALLARFNEENAGRIAITNTTLEWGTPYSSKIQTSAAIGTASDIALYHLARSSTGVSTGVLTEITDTELASVGLSKDDFDPAQVAAASVDGKLYAIPFDLHPVVVYHNAERLCAAGLLGEDGRTAGMDGKEAFSAALQTLVDNGARCGVTTATADGGTLWRIYYSIFSQTGGSFFEDGKFLPGDNFQKAVDAAEVLRGLIDSGLMPAQTEYVTSIALFTSGAFAMHINGLWELPTMVDLQRKGHLFEFGAMLIPDVFGNGHAHWCDGTSFVIPANAGNPMTPEKRKAVLEVIAWFVRHSLDWADAGYILPCRQVADQVQHLEPQSFYGIFPELVAAAHFDPQTPLAGPAYPIYDAVGDFILPAVNGEMDTVAAFTALRDRLQALQDALK